MDRVTITTTEAIRLEVAGVAVLLTDDEAREIIHALAAKVGYTVDCCRALESATGQRLVEGDCNFPSTVPTTPPFPPAESADVPRYLSRASRYGDIIQYTAGLSGNRIVNPAHWSHPDYALFAPELTKEAALAQEQADCPPSEGAPQVGRS